MSSTFMVLKEGVDTSGFEQWPEHTIFVAAKDSTLTGVWLKNGAVPILSDSGTDYAGLLVNVYPPDSGAPNGAQVAFFPLVSFGPGPIAAWELFDVTPWLIFGDTPLPFPLPAGAIVTVQTTKVGGENPPVLGAFEIVIGVTP